MTAFVAAIVGFIALLQVREARRLREEQAQPYVVVYMEPSAAAPQIIDIVVRNFGATVAHNVQIEVTPPLRRTVPSGEEEVWLFDRLPVLVPGQEWRTLWDFAPSRASSDLPDRYEAVVSYEDSRGKRLPPLRYVLDWGTHSGRQMVVTYTLHDAAKALREINSKMSRWQERADGGLSVWVRDGDARDKQLRDAWEAQRESPEETERPSGQESIGNHNISEDEK
jgi:hypothetical protein